MLISILSLRTLIILFNHESHYPSDGKILYHSLAVDCFRFYRCSSPTVYSGFVTCGSEEWWYRSLILVLAKCLCLLHAHPLFRCVGSLMLFSLFLIFDCHIHGHLSNWISSFIIVNRSFSIKVVILVIVIVIPLIIN